MSLIVGFFIGSVGLAYMIYGKKSSNFLFLIDGLIMMIYPYFVDNTALSLVIGLILAVVPFIAKGIA